MKVLIYLDDRYSYEPCDPDFDYEAAGIQTYEVPDATVAFWAEAKKMIQLAERQMMEFSGR